MTAPKTIKTIDVFGIFRIEIDVVSEYLSQSARDITKVIGIAYLHGGLGNWSWHPSKHKIFDKIDTNDQVIPIYFRPADKSITPLHVACYNGNLSAVKLWISSGADLESMTIFNSTPLYLTIEKGHDDIIDLLVASGVDIEKVYGGDGGDVSTALHIACYYGKLSTVKRLIYHGASIEKTNAHGQNAMDIAKSRGHNDILKYLMD